MSGHQNFAGSCPWQQKSLWSCLARVTRGDDGLPPSCCSISLLFIIILAKMQHFGYLTITCFARNCAKLKIIYSLIIAFSRLHKPADMLKCFLLITMQFRIIDRCDLFSRDSSSWPTGWMSFHSVDRGKAALQNATWSINVNARSIGKVLLKNYLH